MKKIQADRLDSFDDYEMVEAPTPTPGENEVLVKVGACGMGYVDALLALGGYQVKPELPFTPGQEIGGIVAAAGTGVSTLSVGDRVMCSSFGGGLAEYVALPGDAVFPIPDAMSLAQAAAFRINYITAIHALIDRAQLAGGERILVFGSAGGVGTAAVQIASLLGAEVIAVASTDEKQAFAVSNGAHLTLDTEVEGWRDRLNALTGGQKIDVVFDPVCGPLFELAFRSLAWRGRHLVVGFAGGPFPKLPVNLPLMKGGALTGVDVRQFLLYEGLRAKEHLETLLDWVDQGKLKPPVGPRFPFDDFKAAMQFAMEGKAMGKTVIEVAQDI